VRFGGFEVQLRSHLYGSRLLWLSNRLCVVDLLCVVHHVRHSFSPPLKSLLISKRIANALSEWRQSSESKARTTAFMALQHRLTAVIFLISEGALASSPFISFSPSLNRVIFVSASTDRRKEKTTETKQHNTTKQNGTRQTKIKPPNKKRSLKRQNTTKATAKNRCSARAAHENQSSPVEKSHSTKHSEDSKQNDKKEVMDKKTQKQTKTPGRKKGSFNEDTHKKKTISRRRGFPLHSHFKGSTFFPRVFRGTKNWLHFKARCGRGCPGFNPRISCLEHNRRETGEAVIIHFFSSECFFLPRF